jgi:hypothetical protein
MEPSDLARGVDLARQGQRGAAQSALRRALFTEGDSAVLRLWLAEVADDPQERLEHLERAHDLEPQSPDVVAALTAARRDPAVAFPTPRAAGPRLVTPVADAPGARPASVVCPACRTINVAGQAACARCGATLPGAEAPAPAPPGARDAAGFIGAHLFANATPAPEPRRGRWPLILGALAAIALLALLALGGPALLGAWQRAQSTQAAATATARQTAAPAATATAGAPSTATAGAAAAAAADSAGYRAALGPFLDRLRAQDAEVVDLVHQVDNNIVTPQIAATRFQTITQQSAAFQAEAARLDPPAALQSHQARVVAALETRAGALAGAASYVERLVELAAANTTSRDATQTYHDAETRLAKQNTPENYAALLRARTALEEAQSQVNRLQTYRDQDHDRFLTGWQEYNSALPPPP